MNPVQSRAQGKCKLTNVNGIKKLDGSPFLIEILLNKSFYSDALLDSGCLCYSAFNLSFVKRHKLPRLPIQARELKLAKKDSQGQAITEITCVDIDIDGKHERIRGYIIEDLAYNMILGDPWMRQNNIVYNARPRYIRFGPPGGLIVRAKGWEKLQSNELQVKVECLKVVSGTARQITGSDFESIASMS